MGQYWASIDSLRARSAEAIDRTVFKELRDDLERWRLEGDPPYPELNALLAAGGIANPTAADIAEARRWRLLGLAPERIRAILEAVRSRAPEPPRAAAYFAGEVERLASQLPPAARALPDKVRRHNLELVEKYLRGTGRALPQLASHEAAAAMIERGHLTGWDDAIARGFDVDRSRIPRAPRPAAE